MIKQIKWKDHPILGDLELDFTKEDGSIYNTIVFAGENGTGKTTILENLSEFLNLGALEYIDYIKYVVNDEEYSLYPQDEFTGAKFGFHKRKNETTGEIINVSTGKHDIIREKGKNLEDIRSYGCSYSRARSGFETKRVTSTTTQQLDGESHENDENQDFTSIKQLIVDVQTQDSSEWWNIAGNEDKPSFEEFKKQSKIFRFENAFNTFFDTISFKKIDNNDPTEKRILFEKHGKEISIDQLSTGEKQIVFRGAHLLKNAKNLSNGTVLIDEPEISMHPKWQEKILSYYRNLFTNGGVQTTQIMFATHSNYVLKSSLEDKDNVLVIILQDKDGTINAKKVNSSFILPMITAAEINYWAFNILSVDYHIQLYGYLQEKENKFTVKACDDFIFNHIEFNQALHGKNSSYKGTSYQTLPTFVRNSIDHPATSASYTSEELRISLELLIELCN